MGGGKVEVGSEDEAMPPSQKILGKNHHAFWCKIFTCFKMHLVDRGGCSSPLPLESATGLNPGLRHMGAV